jgi:F-type H+-transporting ATPase subunit gamma
MANILDIRRRIRSVVNTRQITKAMKMVSAAKLRPEDGRTQASSAGTAGRKEHSADRRHR